MRLLARRLTGGAEDGSDGDGWSDDSADAGGAGMTGAIAEGDEDAANENGGGATATKVRLAKQQIMEYRSIFQMFDADGVQPSCNARARHSVAACTRTCMTDQLHVAHVHAWRRAHTAVAGPWRCTCATEQAPGLWLGLGAPLSCHACWLLTALTSCACVGGTSVFGRTRKRRRL